MKNRLSSRKLREKIVLRRDLKSDYSNRKQERRETSLPFQKGVGLKSLPRQFKFNELHKDRVDK